MVYIDLQQKLLKQKEDGLNSVDTLTVVQSALKNELKSVQTTVKTESKSYSSAFSLDWLMFSSNLCEDNIISGEVS